MGLRKERVKEYFKRRRREQRKRGYPRSKKTDALKTNQALRSELKRLRMEVDLLRDLLDVLEER